VLQLLQQRHQRLRRRCSAAAPLLRVACVRRVAMVAIVADDDVQLADRIIAASTAMDHAARGADALGLLEARAQPRRGGLELAILLA
jgi:hypothetical protein